MRRDIDELIKVNNTKLQTMLDDNYTVEDIFKYHNFADILASFSGSKEDTLQILKFYYTDIVEFIRSNDKVSEEILFDGRYHRHDLRIDEEVDFELVVSSFNKPTILSNYNKRARDIIFEIIMRLINVYGMDTLLKNKNLVSKEMSYGLFNLEDLDIDKEQVVFIGDNYGKNNIYYFKHLELLKKRINSLIEYCNEVQLAQVKEVLESIDYLLNVKKNRIATTIPDIKALFDFYEKLNRQIILSLLSEDLNNENSVVMVHFIQDMHSNSFDNSMNETLEQSALNSGIDMEKYYYSRKNPFDLKSRIPLKSTYVSRPNFRNIVCSPNTVLSCTISRQKNLTPHLNRRIAIGFLPKDIHFNAILATNKNFNSEKDRYDFEKDSHSIAEILDSDETNMRSNETLVDWTKVSASYIYVYLYGDELDNETMMIAEEISAKTGLVIIKSPNKNKTF